MPRRVVIAPSAAEDLRGARKWLLQPGSGANALARWDALLAARRRLGTYPYSGLRDEDHEGCRVVSVSGYRIIYQVTPDTGNTETAGDVEVLRVFGPGQLSDEL